MDEEERQRLRRQRAEFAPFDWEVMHSPEMQLTPEQRYAVSELARRELLRALEQIDGDFVDDVIDRHLRVFLREAHMTEQQFYTLLQTALGRRRIWCIAGSHDGDRSKCHQHHAVIEDDKPSRVEQARAVRELSSLVFRSGASMLLQHIWERQHRADEGKGWQNFMRSSWPIGYRTGFNDALEATFAWQEGKVAPHWNDWYDADDPRNPYDPDKSMWDQDFPEWGQPVGGDPTHWDKPLRSWEAPDNPRHVEGRGSRTVTEEADSEAGADDE